MMGRNIYPSYLTNQEAGKVPTRIIKTWRITDKNRAAPRTDDTRRKRASPFRRTEDCAPYLLVRDCGAGRAGKIDDFEALEADFATPFFEIGGRIIERIAEIRLACLVTREDQRHSRGAYCRSALRLQVMRAWKRKLIAFASFSVESGEESELARKKCAEFEANNLDGAINSRQLLSINFLRPAFSE